ncbi:AbrB family transcriptional regulator [Massilia sp. ZL223]|uniref:AbrB family transcriptional regulator n=1 Tax=Massilia sp. ZL223 TaxID=2824904 RepID=UPI001E569081|nr:AbrB family transcriptional regulator [Massilia sp. ZL223]
MGVLSPPPPGLRRFAPALLLALAAAQACVALDTPLPWMIGPLFSTALACMAGARMAAPVQAREAGQWAIGSALGLYFSAPVLAVLARNIGWIALAVAFAICLGMAAGALLRRLAGVDEATAFFAMAVGGASEMAVQGERHGAAVDRVAEAHSLRIMMVVGLIPFAVRWLSGHGWGEGHDPFVPLAATVHVPGLILLILLTGAAALLLKRLQLPNAWVIGPLAVSLMLTAAGVELSRLPEWMIRAGQLFIGISLGTRFTPHFVRTAPRYLGGVAACTLVTMLLAGPFAFLVAMAAGLHPGTMILAASPGGIAEMSLTARVLHQGVPVVTAFHVSRMVVVVVAIGPLYRVWRRLG